MAFKEIPRDSKRGTNPIMTIRGNGQLGLNYGAVKKFNLADFKSLSLFYDEDTGRIGLKPFLDEREKAYKVIVRSDNISIGAKAFLHECDIPYGGKPIKYDLIWDDENQMLIASKRI